MNKKQNKPVIETRHATSLHAAVQYTAPQIEVIDIELTQNILGGSVGDFEPGPDLN